MTAQALAETHWEPPVQEVFFLPYQEAWYADRSPVKISAKSRRIGITWATAYEAVEVASTCEEDGGMDVYFMTTSQDDARLFVDTCVKWIENITPTLDEIIEVSEVQSSEDWFADEDEQGILAFRITFPSGFTIYALSSRPARLRGKQGFVIIDEAAFLDLDTAMKAASGAVTWGRGRIAVISTYNGASNAFFRRVQRAKKDPRSASLHETNIYEALDQGLFKRICATSGREWSEEAQAEWLEQQRSIDPDGFPEEFECVVGGSSGQLYPRSDVMRCLTLSRVESMSFEIKGGENPTCWVDQEQVDQLAGVNWDGEEADAPAKRREALKVWLDRCLYPGIKLLNETGLPIYVGGDYGRKKNPTSFVLGPVDRSLVRSILLKVELENMRWPMQDQVLDYIWAHLDNLKAGCTDGTGAGGPSAERAQEKTGGLVRAVVIGTKWHEPAFRTLGDRISEQGIRMSRHDSDALEDLCSIKRSNGKIIAPERVTDEPRNQRRHAELAFALAMFESSVGLDGPDTVHTSERKPTGRRRVRGRNSTRGRLRR